MVRLSDLHEVEAEHMRKRAEAMQPVEAAPWISPKPLHESTIAIVSTAGLHRRSDAPFNVGAVDYRLIPGDVDFADVVVSHISTNFDRSAFQQDSNIWFPLERLREMAAGREKSVVSRNGIIPLWVPNQTTRHLQRPEKRSDGYLLPTRLMWR